MQSRLIPLKHEHLESVVEFANAIYESAPPEKYPDFRISADINDTVRRTKFFTAFIVPNDFNDYNIRQCYAYTDKDGKYIAAVGVRRWAHMPSWSVSWLLSPSIGVKFIPVFREIIHELCKIHEAAGMNEFFVTYPSSRESAYSKIMLPFRERYYSFVECTVPAKTASPYEFIQTLMGNTLHPHDMNLRRYILRRDNTDPASLGGEAIRTKRN